MLWRNLRPEVARETQLCLPWAIKRPGGFSFLRHHRKGEFFLILGKRNMLRHFWGKQLLPAPRILLGIMAGKAKMQTKVCLPSTIPSWL